MMLQSFAGYPYVDLGVPGAGSCTPSQADVMVVQQCVYAKLTKFKAVKAPNCNILVFSK